MKKDKKNKHKNEASDYFIFNDILDWIQKFKLFVTNCFSNYRNEKGKEYVRTELVRKPIVVQTYTRIRQTKDAEFIKQFATLDEAAKEEMKKVKVKNNSRSDHNLTVFLYYLFIFLVVFRNYGQIHCVA